MKTRRTPLEKKVKYIISVWAKKFGLLHTLKSISREKYAEKISASLLYGILSSVAVNFFFQPGHVCLFKWSNWFSSGYFSCQ